MNDRALRPWTFFLAVGAAIVGMLTLWQLEPRVAALWLNTACLAGGACLVALPLGGLAALLIDKTDVPGRRLAGLVFIGMLFVPLYVTAGAWDAGFGIQGWHTLSTNPHLAREPWLSGWRAAVWVHGLGAVPWVVLIVGAGLKAVESEIEEDAATCASAVRVLLRVTVRRSAPAFAVAALWVAVTASAEISVTDFFQVRTFAEEVYTQAALGAFDSDGHEALSAKGLWIGLLISICLAMVAVAAAGQWFASFVDLPLRPAWIARPRRWRWALAALLWSILLLVAGVPLANLVYKAGVHVAVTPVAEHPSPQRSSEGSRSIDGRVRTWSGAKVAERVAAAPGEYRGDLWLSVRIGVAAATAAVAIALPLAWVMRSHRGVTWIALAALGACLTIPGPLLGVGLIRLLNRPDDSLFSFLTVLYDTNFAPWLVQTVRALPITTLITWPALASLPQAVLDAAATEGSGPWGRLFRIALPLRWPAVAAAWLLALAIGMGELGATILVIPPQQSTAISVRIFQLLHYGVDDRVAAICLVMVAGIVVLSYVANTLLRRGSWRTGEQPLRDRGQRR
jgi:iron(III) transport system permease protein